MKILFCGGGTAGHITPAIAIAQQILKKDKTADILFIGRENGDENKMITDAGFSLKTLKIYGLERKITIENLKRILAARKALREAKKIIEDFKPNIVVGTGGYVSWPIVKAAQLLKIPNAIHEANACPGLVSKFLAKGCTDVLLGFEDAKKEFNKSIKTKAVGIPVREGFDPQRRKISRRKLGIPDGAFLISSFGGSGGSAKINETVVALMQSYSSKQKNIYHIHSSGRKYYEAIKNEYPTFISGQNGCKVLPYIEDSATVITASDVVISRCGAITLTEICAAGVAAILIPSPNVTNNHQYKNARLIANGEAAILIEEKDLNERTLTDAVRMICAKEKAREKLREKIRQYYIPKSAEKIVEELYAISSK